MNKTKTMQLMEQEENYIQNKTQEPDFYLIDIKNNQGEKTMTILAKKPLKFKRLVLDYNDLDNPDWDLYENLSNNSQYIQANNIDW